MQRSNCAKYHSIDQIISEWAYLPICRHLNFGFRKQQMAIFLLSIPPNIAHEFKKLLQKVQDSLFERIQNLQRFQSSIGQPTNRSEEHDDDIEAKLWKEQNICGYLKISYHPSTQIPFKVDFNEKLVQQIGLGVKEMERAFADQRLPIPFSDVDFFFLLVDDTKQALRCRTDRFGMYFHYAQDQF